MHKRNHAPRVVDLSGPYGGFARPRLRPVEALPPLREKSAEHEARYLDALSAKYRNLMRLLAQQPDLIAVRHRKYRHVVRTLTAVEDELQQTREALAALQHENTALSQRCAALEAQISGPVRSE